MMTIVSAPEGVRVHGSKKTATAIPLPTGVSAKDVGVSSGPVYGTNRVYNSLENLSKREEVNYWHGTPDIIDKGSYLSKPPRPGYFEVGHIVSREDFVQPNLVKELEELSKQLGEKMIAYQGYNMAEISNYTDKELKDILTFANIQKEMAKTEIALRERKAFFEGRIAEINRVAAKAIDKLKLMYDGCSPDGDGVSPANFT